MSFTLSHIDPETNVIKGFSYNGESFSELRKNGLKGALIEVLEQNIELRERQKVGLLLAKERLFGLDSQVKDMRFNKLMQQIKSDEDR